MPWICNCTQEERLYFGCYYHKEFPEILSDSVFSLMIQFIDKRKRNLFSMRLHYRNSYIPFMVWLTLIKLMHCWSGFSSWKLTRCFQLHKNGDRFLYDFSVHTEPKKPHGCTVKFCRLILALDRIKETSWMHCKVCKLLLDLEMSELPCHIVSTQKRLLDRLSTVYTIKNIP